MMKPPKAPRPRPRLVIAEDDEALLELVTLRLRGAGYDIFPARNGLEALRQIEAINPAGVLLDINMPVMDGFETLKELNSTPRGRTYPTLVMTARNRPEDVRTAIGLGARDYVSKPFDDAQFLARVARLIGRIPALQPAGEVPPAAPVAFPAADEEKGGPGSRAALIL